MTPYDSRRKNIRGNEATETNEQELGFLFNFIAGKSTRFDLEALKVIKRVLLHDYLRFQPQTESNWPPLKALPESFLNDFNEFSDTRLMQWMTETGNRFKRNASGSWAHVSGRELSNLRRHYVEILHKLWPVLCKWPNIFMLRTGRFSNYYIKSVKLSPEPVKLSFTVKNDGVSITITMNIEAGGTTLGAFLRGGVVFEKNDVLYLPPDPSALSIFDQFKTGLLKFPVEEKNSVLKRLVIPLQEKYPVKLVGDLKIERINPEPEPRVMLTELNDNYLMLRPQFMYNNTLIDYDVADTYMEESPEQLTIITRNKAEEQKLYEFLRTLHPKFTNQRNNQYYYVPFDDVMKNKWYITMIRNVQKEGYPITGLHDLKKFRYNTNVPQFNIQASSTIDWFDLKITIHWGEHEVSLKEIRQTMLNRQDSIMLPDGTLGLIPAEWTKLYGALLRSGTEKEGTLRINKLHYTLLADISDQLNDEKVKEEIEAKKRKLQEFNNTEKTPVSSEIKATLRPYQESGLHWMRTLDDMGWGGCLADDMGLGKTLQTISFLQYLKEKYPESTQLVVCPTSLIFNWENEIKKFCPTLKYYTYYGTQRAFTEEHFQDYDVVLTSYGVVRNDLETLTPFEWKYIFLDESHAIKNPDSKVTRAIQKLIAINRIALSGTPLQNNTNDLFAQFNFVNPGLLGNREFFNREFATPIDKYGDKEKAESLRRLIYPFILRRTKENVAKDLPDKTVTVLWCSMGAEQRKLYENYRDHYRSTLLSKIDQEGLPKSGIYVLEGLLRLRQICDHPALLKDKTNEVDKSVKIKELTRELQENAGDHKFLIFSQFTEMLQIIQQEFTSQGISHCYLDGSTPLNKRKEEVERFQEDPGVKAFLISLKAGGVGLTLTAADYVYLIDPWWNPAAEQQAIDRTHRIGQTKKIFAYKMICKDTVEEKILQLQEKKSSLADELISEEGGFVKNLTRDDIAFLFS